MRCSFRFGTSLLFGAGFAVLIALAPAEAAKPKKAAAPKPTVRIGIISSLFRETPEPIVKVVMAPFKAIMETQTGIQSELVNGGDYKSLGDKLANNEIQVGIFHGFEFAWARLDHPDLKPFLIAVNKQRVLRADLVVRADSKATGPADLKGQTICLPTMSREHCRLYLERRCTQPGIAPDKFYGKVETRMDSEDALDAIVDGKIQAAVIDNVTLQWYRFAKPGRATDLKVLHESEPTPCAVVVSKPGVFGDDLVQKFRDGMVSAKSTVRGRQMLQLCRITGFEDVPEDYDDLFDATAKAFPPPVR